MASDQDLWPYLRVTIDVDGARHEERQLCRWRACVYNTLGYYLGEQYGIYFIFSAPDKRMLSLRLCSTLFVTRPHLIKLHLVPKRTMASTQVAAAAAGGGSEGISSKRCLPCEKDSAVQAIQDQQKISELLGQVRTLMSDRTTMLD